MSIFSRGILSSLKGKRTQKSASSLAPRLRSSNAFETGPLSEAEKYAKQEMENLWEQDCNAYMNLLSEVEHLHISIRDVPGSVLRALAEKVGNETGKLCQSVEKLKHKLGAEPTSSENCHDFLTMTYARNGGTLHGLLCAILSIERRDVVTHIINDEREESIRAFIDCWKNCPLRQPQALEAQRPRPALDRGNPQPALTYNWNIQPGPDCNLPDESVMANSLSLKQLFRHLEQSHFQDMPPSSANPQIVDNQTVTIFITHTDEDLHLAEWLAYILRHFFNFFVLLQEDISGIKPISPAEMWYDIISKVDFIIPLVTKQYLLEIKASRNSVMLEDPQLDVRRIFRECQDLMTRSTCLNFRIRPVCHGLLPGDLRSSSMELRWPFKLCERDMLKMANSLMQTKSSYFGDPTAGFVNVEEGIHSLPLPLQSAYNSVSRVPQMQRKIVC